MDLEAEFYVMDCCYDMIDFTATWDKQFSPSLTNSRCCSFKETTYIEVKCLFLGLPNELCYGSFHILLLWVVHCSPKTTISFYQSFQGNRSRFVRAVDLRSHIYQLYLPRVLLSSNTACILSVSKQYTRPHILHFHVFVPVSLVLKHLPCALLMKPPLILQRQAPMPLASPSCFSQLLRWRGSLHPLLVACHLDGSLDSVTI